jgi:hypothetical protein
LPSPAGMKRSDIRERSSPTDRVGTLAEVAGAQLGLGQHALDRLDDGAGGFRLAEVLEHHRARPVAWEEPFLVQEARFAESARHLAY